MHVTEKHLLKQIIKHHMILNIMLNNVKLKKLLSKKKI